MKVRRFKGRERGQAVVEFALLGMALLLFFAGTVDFSRFMYYQSALTSSARVAAQLAGEPCATQNLCGRTKITTDDYIQQGAICDAKPYMPLNSTMSAMSGFSCDTCITASCVSPCGSTACPDACTQDVCVLRCPTGYTDESQCTKPYNSSSNPSGLTPARGQTVVVDVGYNFQPITPVIRQFIRSHACWPGDTGVHTLCGHSVIRVFP